MSAFRNVTSDFAVLDVKAGRHELAEHFKDLPTTGPCPEALRIPVVIRGYIDGRWSKDDGTSIEFSVQVDRLDVGLEPKGIPPIWGSELARD